MLFAADGFALHWWEVCLLVWPLTLSLLLCALYALIVSIVFALGYALYFRSLVLAIKPEYRQLGPGSVWLLFLPGFNLFWHLWLVVKLGKSCRNQIEHLGSKPKEMAIDIVLGILIFVLNVAFIILAVLLFYNCDSKLGTIYMIFLMCDALVIPALMFGHFSEIVRLREHLYRS